MREKCKNVLIFFHLLIKTGLYSRDIIKILRRMVIIDGNEMPENFLYLDLRHHQIIK